MARVFDDPSHRVHEEVYCLRGQTDHLLRTDHWALIRYADGEQGVELYDMQSDPHQFTNLADDPRHAQTRADLEKRLAEKLERINAGS